MKPIKWIFAYSQGSEAAYGDLIRVAVTSARARTSLESICLYDGEETPLSLWLQSQGVQVVRCQTVLTPELQALSLKHNAPEILRTGRGAFLRFEIPRLARELGWTDEFVFYSDCDVMFERDPSALLRPLRPRLFAAAPETFRHNNLHMNSGAMWINLAAFAARMPELSAWTARHIEPVCAACWDQGALRVYFHPLHRFLWKIGVPDRLFYAVMTRLRVRMWKWDDLPLELNWKPYWGHNENACLVHFHGLKPTMRGEAERGELRPNIAVLDGPAFQAYATQWDELLKEASNVY